jgi:hypothetical protein
MDRDTIRVQIFVADGIFEFKEMMKAKGVSRKCIQYAVMSWSVVILPPVEGISNASS